ncbi:MAG: hypothetical protein RL150_222 [Candidatus Parcubacteria bacterium]|jgi:UDP-N-acetylmuramyl pentapeptide synthase
MSFIKRIVIAVLIFEAQLVLRRFKPHIIAVVGSVGKTSTKDAIYTALNTTHRIRKNEKSLNSIIGVPLTILGLESAWSSPLGWLKNLVRGLLVLGSRQYPQWLVLEVGADRQGEMDVLCRLISPDVVVLTSLPEIPVHLENFASPEALREDDLSIIKKLRQGGMLILNSDEPLAADVPTQFKVPVITYGTNAHAQVRFETVQTNYVEEDGCPVPIGISCKISSGGNTVPVSLQGVLGVTHLYPLAAAIAVGLSQQVPLLTMVTALRAHEPPHGRMNIIHGIQGTIIIDDTYNASPVATDRAIETLAELRVSGKRIAVLGEMRELGSFSEDEHRRIGEKVAALGITYLFAIGPQAAPMADAARAAGMDPERVMSIPVSTDVAPLLSPLLAPGDVLLVKGSQGVRAERAVAALMRDTEHRKELLVRQDAVWENR